MKKLIVYGSHYGSTQRYAQKFAELTDLPVVSYKELPGLTEYNLIIHFGGLYAGGVLGLKKTLKAMGTHGKLIVITVGLADVTSKETQESILKSLRTQVPEPLLKESAVFHLRGAIDYSKLSFTHKTMMTLLYQKAKKLPEEKQSSDTKAFLETFNSHVDFVDFSSLTPIVKAIS